MTIDLTSLGGRTEGLLLFQLLNLDAATNSTATIQFVSNTVDPNGVSSPVFTPPSMTVAAGPAIETGGMTASQSLVAELANVAYNTQTGVLAVDLSVSNRGAAAGRAMVVGFPNLPANVRLLNASGQLPDGSPYVNLVRGVPRGGLSQQSRTTPVRLEFLDAERVPLTLSPVTHSGGPNRAPVMQAIGTLEVLPGHLLTTKLIATDLDGDLVTFSIRPSSDLPTLRLTANGELQLMPKPGEEGSYVVDVVASDGVLESAQTLVIDVLPDMETSSRVSGTIRDVDGSPLVGVPVSIGRLSVMTDQDGRFLIEFPSMLVPTEEFSIEVPKGDVYFDPQGTGDQLISFRRARYDSSTGTGVNNPRQHPNLVSGFLDASMVYGSDSERALALRTLDGTGQLKTSPGELLPFNNADYFGDAPLENDSAGMVDPGSLFVAGDVRASENVVLASLHTLLVREHNRLAEEIAANDPGLTDEQIYQQARHLVGAIVQNITYYEYLPLLLGSDALQPYSGYQPDVMPEMGAFFATVAFRIGHSQMVSQIDRLDSNGAEIANGHLSLRESFFNSAPITVDGIEPILRGAATQVAEAIDAKVIDELRNFLFGPPGAGGMDLPAMSVQRARDLGLPSYVQARADFGLEPVTRFEDITSDTDLQNRLEETYGTIDRIDAFVGGVAEDHVPGAMVGELFNAAIARQFEDTRNSDRFWFENEQFTDVELSFIRSSTLATLIERNTVIENLPANVFTTGADPGRPVDGGGPAAAPGDESRSYDGSDNNLLESTWGAVGQHLATDASQRYADGISKPNGQDRPSPRAVSNGVLAQGPSSLSPVGATTLGVFWGQLISHDMTLTPTGISDTLRVHGDEVEIEGKQYPFVAEKIELLLGHAFYESTNNVIQRAIYLPALDMANAVTVDPLQETIVTTAAIPLASLAIAAGSLQDGDGNLFDQQLSITAVPPELTPASLPEGLQPDLVVTIQPAELTFMTAAPLSLPNTFGYAPGEMLDLWSINPSSGQFDKVGVGEVSSDGEVIETVQGGIRTSSWQFFAPLPPLDDFSDPNGDDRNKDDRCEECEAAAGLTSEVKLHSGAVIESHDLVNYQSQGVTRGLSLVYDSLRPTRVPSCTLATSASKRLPTACWLPG